MEQTDTQMIYHLVLLVHLRSRFDESIDRRRVLLGLYWGSNIDTIKKPFFYG